MANTQKDKQVGRSRNRQTDCQVYKTRRDPASCNGWQSIHHLSNRHACAMNRCIDEPITFMLSHGSDGMQVLITWYQMVCKF